MVRVNARVAKQPVGGAAPRTEYVEQLAELPRAQHRPIWNRLGAEPDTQLAALRSGLSAWSTFDIAQRVQRVFERS